MEEKATGVSPAVIAAKDKRNKIDSDGAVTLSTGVRVRVQPVPPGVLEDVASRLEPPNVPTWINPEKEREEPNPQDPDYLAAVARYELAQSSAILDAIALFGMELIDEMPEDTRWLSKLRLLSRRGNFDISAYDLEDEIDLEFLYKRYVVLGNDDLRMLSGMIGQVTGGDIERARNSFPTDKA